MNTRNKKDQKNQGPRTRQQHGQKKQGQRPEMLQEHEHPEMRMAR